MLSSIWASDVANANPQARPSMPDRFFKGHALGNDYVVVHSRELSFPLASSAVRLLCDRHDGLGADGLPDGAWPSCAAALEVHPRWPARTNVERLRVAGDHALEVEIYERGVGLTAASGTGACAAAAAAVRLGLLEFGRIRVAMPGG